MSSSPITTSRSKPTRAWTAPCLPAALPFAAAQVGRLVASDIVRLEDGAAVKADVAAPLFSLAEGARFNGRVEPSRVDAAFRVARYRDKA